MDYTFTINNVTYAVHDFDFNTIAELEEVGISAGRLVSPTPNVLRGLLAVNGHMTMEQAGEELTEHIVAGGDFEEMIEALAKSLENSDFFLKLLKSGQEEMEKQKEEQVPEEKPIQKPEPKKRTTTRSTKQ